MPTQWETFPVEVRGGLITNLSPLQQGANFPGSARRLINFEPSIEGGYRRIQGFSKFDTTFIPPYGKPLVQGSGQSGSVLDVANIYYEPSEGDIFTVQGTSGFYTVTGVIFNQNLKTATLNITPALSNSPADKAAVVFSNRDLLTEGAVYFKDSAIVYRGGSLWASSGSGWSLINRPDYGNVLVSFSATGFYLSVDGLTSAPKKGDTFIVEGVEKVYTVTADATVISGASTLSISPTLAGVPANNAQVTFLSTDRSLGKKHRFCRYDFTGSKFVLGVDGVNRPFSYDGTTFKVFHEAPQEVLGATQVVEFKNHLFFGKENVLSFTAPYTDSDFSPANGAGTIKVPAKITGLIVFREQLIIFAVNKIYRLVGNTVADFQLQPISYDIGCIREDTIQEVGGDIVFLGPDGVRLLSATERIGDFGFAVASRVIQSEVNRLVDVSDFFSSCVIRKKSQYRLFGYAANRNTDTSLGVLATQFSDQTTQGMSWSETRGIMSYVSDSIYSEDSQEEVVIFANKNGYLYQMESGNTFDQSPIEAFYYTPYWSINDPRIRKSFYKVTTYIDREGSVLGQVTPKLDFDQLGVIQPSPIDFSNTSQSPSYYGSTTYNSTGVYGGKLKYTFNNQLVGSGFTVSFQYVFRSTDPPFSLDAIMVEFLNNDRQ